MASLIQTLQHTLQSRDPLLALETKRILLKEVLQSYVLDFIYNHPKYRRLNFYGGTLSACGLRPQPPVRRP
jgi:hypothetical protein